MSVQSSSVVLIRSIRPNSAYGYYQLIRARYQSEWRGPNSHTCVQLGQLLALGMGIHGIGEGLGLGGSAAGTQASGVLDAIGEHWK